MKNNEEVNTEKRIDEVLKSWEVPALKSESEAWAELQMRLEHAKPKAEVLPIRKPWKWYAAAAVAAAVALVLYVAWPATNLEFAAAPGTLREVQLPDGSAAWLNAGTQLEYSSKWNREVMLKGEAEFDVAHGSTFTVRTALGEVQVLGTQFNVFARGNRFEVTCSSGKVKVKSGSEDILLLPGEKATLNNGHLEMTPFNNALGNWRRGEFYYTAAPAEEVFAELERQFNIQIDYTSAAGKTYTGRFDNKNLNAALEVVCLPLGLTFEKDKDKVVLKPRVAKE